MFVYQPAPNTLELKNLCTKYVIGLKSKGVYTFQSTSLYTAFLHNMKIYATKIVTASIVCHLNDWPKKSA